VELVVLLDVSGSMAEHTDELCRVANGIHEASTNGGLSHGINLHLGVYAAGGFIMSEDEYRDAIGGGIMNDPEIATRAREECEATPVWESPYSPAIEDYVRRNIHTKNAPNALIVVGDGRLSRAATEDVMKLFDRGVITSVDSPSSFSPISMGEDVYIAPDRGTGDPVKAIGAAIRAVALMVKTPEAHGEDVANLPQVTPHPFKGYTVRVEGKTDDTRPQGRWRDRRYRAKGHKGG
jgi:hypothetical protein